MTELKRLPVKYIRDKIKKEYKARDCCHICGSTDALELHHLYSLSQMWNTWREENNIGDITTVEQINELRLQFQADYEEKLSNKYLYTLCKPHHLRLHTIYGQTYNNFSVPKILRWLKIQKEKQSGNTK